jgi:hypothetical protein
MKQPMDKATYTIIKDNAQMLVEYADVSRSLREIAKLVVGPSRNKLLALAQSLERLPETLFKPSLARAYRLYREPSLVTRSAAAQKLGASATVQQTVLALKAGGVSIHAKNQNCKAKLAQKKTSTGKGAGYINESLSNEERVEEIVAEVEKAVADLRAKHSWDNLSKRNKITLLKQKTLESRGVAISTQTLYRDWVKDLW